MHALSYINKNDDIQEIMTMFTMRSLSQARSV